MNEPTKLPEDVEEAIAFLCITALDYCTQPLVEHHEDVLRAYIAHQRAVMEAMAAGLPVIAASSGAIPEVVGGPPAELFAPGDWPALAGLLRERLADRPGERVQWPAERLARFSREAEAERLAEAYESMLGR